MESREIVAPYSIDNAEYTEVVEGDTYYIRGRFILGVGFMIDIFPVERYTWTTPFETLLFDNKQDAINVGWWSYS